MTVVSILSIVLHTLVELVCHSRFLPQIRAMRSREDEEEEEVLAKESSSTIRRTVSTSRRDHIRTTGGGGSMRLGATPKPMRKRRGRGKGGLTRPLGQSKRVVGAAQKSEEPEAAAGGDDSAGR